MNKKLKYILTHYVCPLFSVILLFFSSCTKLSMFSPPIEPSQEIEVKSLAGGGILCPGESVTFIIHTLQEDEESLNLEIFLTNTSGESVWSTNISSPLINEELELILPDLENGQYTLEFLVSLETGTTIEKKIDFFYTTGEYGITGITSYPPSTFPGSQTLLKADIVAPEDSDPFIRWTQDNTVLAKGLLSDGLTEVTWSAPQKEGVYSIQVELFPIPPLVGSDYDFYSAISMSASIYVSTKQNLSENDLIPEEYYYSLFHFNGAIQDSGEQASLSGTKDSSGEVELIGNPQFVSEGDHYGYRLSGSSGIKYSRIILPVKKGILKPFTLTLALILEERNAGNIVSSVSSDNNFAFFLKLNNEVEPVASFRSGSEGKEIYYQSGIRINPGKENLISLSVLPLEKKITVRWFYNGLPSASSVQNIRLGNLSDTGSTLIGGEKGFNGVITELGVFFRDEKKRETIDPSIYRRSMEKKYGRNLVFADGFDGQYLSNNLILENEGSLKAGSFQISPGSSLVLPSFEVTSDETVVEVFFSESLPQESTASFTWERAKNPFLIISEQDRIEVSGKTEYFKTLSGKNPVLRVFISDNKVSVDGPDGLFSSAILKPKTGSSWVIVRLSNPELESRTSRGKSLDIDRITIYQNNL